MIKQLKDHLEQREADYFLVTNSANLSYILSDGKHSSERLKGILIVGKDKNLLLTSNFYRYQSFHLPQSEQLEHKIYQTGQERDQLLSQLKLEGQLLTDAEGESYSELEDKFDSISQSQLLAELRLKKSDSEIKKIRKACSKADQAMEAVHKSLEEGVTAIELALVADKVIRQGGSDFNRAFPTLVQINSLQPHRQPDSQQVSPEDLVIVDLGAAYQGYCSDMTRTFSLNPTQEKREAFSDVKECYQMALDQLKTGKNLKDIDDRVKSFFQDKGYDLDLNYLHSVGHGVGLQAHEPPFVRQDKEKEKDSDFSFKPGVVVALEPALYLPQLGGIRIEDTILIKKGGKKEKLTSFPCQL